MSIRVMTIVWEDSKSKGTDLLLLLALADMANDQGISWPGLDTLAHKSRLTRPTVQAHLDALVQAGELYIHAKPGFVHRYLITLGKSPEAIKAAIAEIEKSRGGPSKYLPRKLALPVKRVFPHPVNGLYTPPKTSFTRSVNDPSKETSSALRDFWENEIKTPFPSGVFFERLEYKVEVYGIVQVKAALLKANKYAKAHNLNYVETILKTPDNSKPTSKPERQPARIYR